MHEFMGLVAESDQAGRGEGHEQQGRSRPFESGVDAQQRHLGADGQHLDPMPAVVAQHRDRRPFEDRIPICPGNTHRSA